MLSVLDLFALKRSLQARMPALPGIAGATSGAPSYARLVFSEWLEICGFVPVRESFVLEVNRKPGPGKAITRA
jgi:hypothetical protein